ncbi:MAG TPA: hypothetical protein VFV38_08395 [Ktedonobacteraceae bacterium]|nr:hypothetical protein [Ktedonobacteraceae bacterium]
MQEEKRRSHAGQPVPQSRDRLALPWIAEQFTATSEQVRRLLARFGDEPGKTILSDSSTRNAIERWLTLDYIDKPQRLWGQYTRFIWLSRSGLRQFGLPYRYYIPKQKDLYHHVQVNEVRLSLQERPNLDIWIPRRTLQAGAELEQKLRKTNAEAAEDTNVFFPDGLLRLPSERVKIAVCVIEREPQPYELDLREMAQQLAQQYGFLRYYVCAEMLEKAQELQATFHDFEQFELYDLKTMQLISNMISTVQDSTQTGNTLPVPSCEPHARNPARRVRAR